MRGAIVQCLQRTLSARGRIPIRLVSSLTGLDLTKQENLLLFVPMETTDANPVKQKTAILPPSVSFFEWKYLYLRPCGSNLNCMCKIYALPFFKKWAIPGLFFFIFVFSIQLTVNVQYKLLPMTRFKPQTSGIGSDISTN